jgi:hypothetical protein
VSPRNPSPIRALTTTTLAASLAMTSRKSSSSNLPPSLTANLSRAAAQVESGRGDVAKW